MNISMSYAPIDIGIAAKSQKMQSIPASVKSKKAASFTQATIDLPDDNTKKAKSEKTIAEIQEITKSAKSKKVPKEVTTRSIPEPAESTPVQYSSYIEMRSAPAAATSSENIENTENAENIETSSSSVAIVGLATVSISGLVASALSLM